MVLLTCCQAQSISKISNVQTKKVAIAEYVLGLVDFEADNDMFNDSLVDFYFYLFDFCVMRGMPWKEVVASVEFASMFLNCIPNVSMANAVCKLKSELIEYIKKDKLGQKSAKKLTCFFVSTVISHFKLYQYIFTKPQDVISHSCEMLVEVPPPNCLSNLQSAETVAAWKYKQKLNEMSERRELKIKEIDDQKEAHIEKCFKVNLSIDTALKSHEQDSTSLDFDEAKNLVLSMTSDKLGLVDDNVSLVLTKMKDDLNFEIEAKVLASTELSSDSNNSKKGSRSSSASKSGKGRKSRKK